MLYSIGVPEKLKGILMAFLRDRRTYVDIEGEFLSILKIRTGVPQGSVLGPKILSVYTRGLSLHGP